MTEAAGYPPLIPVILSGGAGTRLWPVSRRAHPNRFPRTEGVALQRMERTRRSRRQERGLRRVLSSTLEISGTYLAVRRVMPESTPG